MQYRIHIIFFILLSLCGNMQLLAQKKMRDEIRLGNRSYRNEAYSDAEVHYRKVLQGDPYNTIALYNLGNALTLQGKDKEAMEQGYEPALRRASTPQQKAMIYHNMGDLYMASKNYPQAVEAFKNSLRNDPTNDETRYNLALAQKLLKKNQQQQDQEQQKQKEQKQDKKEEPKPQSQKDPKKPNPDSQSKRDEMSKETAEQLLKAAMQDEQRLREKMKKAAAPRGRDYEKDW